ncbi:MAG: cation:proton antiporter [Pseudomonadota bacterium]
MLDIVWIGIAFILGLGARQVGLPLLVGFLAAGFVLFGLGAEPTETLDHFAAIGITLLLFSIGLKLRIDTLLKPQVWGVGSLHMAIVTLTLGFLVLGFAATGMALVADLNIWTAIIVGFALSFSSTVFAVKILEESGETASIYGRTAIGILIVQDIAAVAFLSASTRNDYRKRPMSRHATPACSSLAWDVSARAPMTPWRPGARTASQVSILLPRWWQRIRQRDGT